MPQIEEAAFRLTPDLRFLFPHDAHESAFAELCDGIQRGVRLLLITGPFGVGKTLLLRRIEATLIKGGILATYAGYPQLDLASLLTWFAENPTDGTYTGEVNHGVSEETSNRPAPETKHRVLMLDDADRCSNKFLQELQALIASSTPTVEFQFMLAGSEGIADRLKAEFPDIWRSIHVHARLAPLDRTEVGAYIRHRLVRSGNSEIALANDAERAVFRYSRGIPRLINHACARALLLAGSDRPLISHEIAREAIDDYVANASFGQIPDPEFMEAARSELTVPSDGRDAPSLEASNLSAPVIDTAENDSAVAPIDPSDLSAQQLPNDISAQSEIENPPFPPPAPGFNTPTPQHGMRPSWRLLAMRRRVYEPNLLCESSERPPKFAGFRARRIAAQMTPAAMSPFGGDQQQPRRKHPRRNAMLAAALAIAAATGFHYRTQLSESAAVQSLRSSVGAFSAKAVDALHDGTGVLRRIIGKLLMRTDTQGS